LQGVWYYLVRGFVIGKIGSVGIIVGLIIGAALISKRFDLGPTVLGALKGFGSNVGQGITAPFQGILEGLTIGGEDLGESAVSLSEGFQSSVLKTLGITDKTVFFPPTNTDQNKLSITPTATSNTGSSGGFEIDSIISKLNTEIFSVDNIKRRLGSSGGGTTSSSIPARTSLPFGGFGSAQGQETALTQAIAESLNKFPGAFKTALGV